MTEEGNTVERDALRKALIEALMRKFEANLYLAKKTAEGCPSKWQDEGDATLTPGPEMVGRVHEALYE